MRNKFVNFYSLKNPCFRIQQTLGKHILPPAGCGKVFPAKSCQDARKSGNQLARGQVNMADEAKPLSLSSSGSYKTYFFVTRHNPIKKLFVVV